MLTLMINITNNTPFSTSITIHGGCRIIGEVKFNTEIAPAPSFLHWFIEWFLILMYGPMYSSISFTISPWSAYNLNIYSNSESTMTMGFSDCKTQWKKHMPGIYKWDSKGMDLVITCQPGEFSIIRRGRGPMLAGDVPLNIITESSNKSWKVSQKPITTVQYLPSFNYDYYTTNV